MLALSARVLDDLGFEVIYLTGAGATNMRAGLATPGLPAPGGEPKLDALVARHAVQRAHQKWITSRSRMAGGLLRRH